MKNRRKRLLGGYIAEDVKCRDAQWNGFAHPSNAVTKQEPNSASSFRKNRRENLFFRGLHHPWSAITLEGTGWFNRPHGAVREGRDETTQNVKNNKSSTKNRHE